MKTLCKPAPSTRSGWTLAFSLLAVSIAAVTAAVLMTRALSADRAADLERSQMEARYCAEGALEIARRELAHALANWVAPPAKGTTEIHGILIPYTITPTGYDATLVDASGIQTVLEGFEIEAVATVRETQVRARRVVKARSTPIFQFAIFYQGDLEIFPGPDMELDGRVHTNGDLYVGSGATLTVDTNYFRAVGQVFRDRKDDPGESSGSVRIRRWVADPFDAGQPVEYVEMLSKAQLDALGIASESGYDSRFTAGWDAEGDGDFYGSYDHLPWALGSARNWEPPSAYRSGKGRTVLSAEHGMATAVAPHIGSIRMFEKVVRGSYERDEDTGEFVETTAGTGTHDKGFFHDSAGLAILTHDDGSFTATNEAGQDVTGSLSGVVTVKTMHDARQGGEVIVTELDLARLNISGVFPSNGLLYGADYRNGLGKNLKGLKLVNGGELAGPLTVVSEGGVYVQGDYNTTNKVGAAVIADAVNLLSSSWDDSKEPGSLPVASDTTFHLAFISGNQDTSTGQYNGGFENLPRLHEDWGGKDCRIVGSMVNAWTSEFADGGWKYGADRYEAPNRLWSYDPAFNRTTSLPPFTPMAVTVEDAVTW